MGEPRRREPEAPWRRASDARRTPEGAGESGAAGMSSAEGGAGGALPEPGGAGGAVGGTEAGAGGETSCAPGELTVVTAEPCDRIGICNARGDGFDLMPCREGDVYVHPKETVFRVAQVDEVVTVFADGFTTENQYYNVTSQRQGTIVSQFLYDDYQSMELGYTASEVGADTLLVSVGEQTGTVRFVVQP